MSNNFVQNLEGFPDVDYEWGQDDNYQGFVNTAVEEKMRAEYYTNASGDPATCIKANDTITINDNGTTKVVTASQALEGGHITCERICEADQTALGCEDKSKKTTRKVGSWITNFLAGTGLYRPMPVYDPNSPTHTPIPPGGLLYGCTNPDALNYNPMANQDDGSCDIEKGLSPLAWAGIGVGAILLIVGIVALSSGGGKSPRRKTTTRRRRKKSSYARKPRSSKTIVNLED
jgi:hypothetical protein